MSNVKIIKPIPKYANVVNGNAPQTTATIKPLAVAATTLKEGSVVYLLHQLPYNFLLTDFYDHHQHYNKIPVSYLEAPNCILFSFFFTNYCRFMLGINI